MIPELIGGSADLTGSNNTKAGGMKAVTATDFSARYVYYGVREHGMAAAMNGIALYGGFIPYGGTFLVFTDYCRPSIRLSALMQQRVIYVMTHDSIGLGEDGPTHQPVEHLAALRAIPNLLVMRPCDTVETAECWAAALAEKDRPTVLALTRQGLADAARRRTPTRTLCRKGGYVLAEADGKRRATLIATGSEVSLAMEAQAKLQAEGIGAAVVSLPCWELFDAQPEPYRRDVLGDGVRVAIEAAGPFGWERYLGADGAVIGMRSFGASGPAPELYKHFGITADAAVQGRESATLGDDHVRENRAQHPVRRFRASWRGSAGGRRGRCRLHPCRCDGRPFRAQPYRRAQRGEGIAPAHQESPRRPSDDRADRSISRPSPTPVPTSSPSMPKPAPISTARSRSSRGWARRPACRSIRRRPPKRSNSCSTRST